MDQADTSREVARQNYDALTAEAAERLRFQIGFAEQALKGLMLVNGGAVIALYTVIGNSGPLSLDAGKLWTAFGCFVAGLVLTLLAYLGAFASQSFFYASAQYEAWNEQAKTLTGRIGGYDHRSPHRLGHWAQIVGVGAAVLSVTAFALGAAFALSGVLS